jgi:hypothetical protein
MGKLPTNTTCYEDQKEQHKELYTMNDQNYSMTILVDQTPAEAFAAINNARIWWTGEPGITGSTDKLGDEFTYRYGDVHRSTHKITELVTDKKIVWHTVDSQINFVNNKTEWTGTDIVFEITQKGDQTELRFTHIGLVPSIQCYGDCSGAWGFYVNECLHSLITTGKVPAHAQEA